MAATSTSGSSRPRARTPAASRARRSASSRTGASRRARGRRSRADARIVGGQLGAVLRPVENPDRVRRRRVRNGSAVVLGRIVGPPGNDDDRVGFTAPLLHERDGAAPVLATPVAVVGRGVPEHEPDRRGHGRHERRHRHEDDPRAQSRRPRRASRTQAPRPRGSGRGRPAARRRSRARARSGRTPRTASQTARAASSASTQHPEAEDVRAERRALQRPRHSGARASRPRPTGTGSRRSRSSRCRVRIASWATQGTPTRRDDHCSEQAVRKDSVAPLEHQHCMSRQEQETHDGVRDEQQRVREPVHRPGGA